MLETEDDPVALADEDVAAAAVPWIVRRGGMARPVPRASGLLLVDEVVPVDPVPPVPVPVLPVPVVVVVVVVVVPVVSVVALAAAMPNFMAGAPASAAPTSGAAPRKPSLKLGMRAPWS